MFALFAASHPGGYPSAIGIATAGVGGFFWVPFAGVYGRKITLLVALAIATAFTAMGGASKTYGELIIARAISGFALAAGPSIGGGVISDLFCLSVCALISFLPEQRRARGEKGRDDRARPHQQRKVGAAGSACRRSTQEERLVLVVISSW